MKTSDDELSDQEAINLYNALRQTYGERLPNFHHSPLEFEYYVRMYRFSESLKKYQNINRQ